MSDRDAAASKRILVADDDACVRRLVAAILRHAGYNVEIAAGGREAIEKIASTPFDAILLDLMMPDVSGFDVLASLAAGHSSRPWVIVMSAASGQVITNAITCHVFAALRKPFDIADLVATVRACMMQGTEPELRKIA